MSPFVKSLRHQKPLVSCRVMQFYKLLGGPHVFLLVTGQIPQTHFSGPWSKLSDEENDVSVKGRLYNEQHTSALTPLSHEIGNSSPAFFQAGIFHSINSCLGCQLEGLPISNSQCHPSQQSQTSDGEMGSSFGLFYLETTCVSQNREGTSSHESSPVNLRTPLWLQKPALHLAWAEQHRISQYAMWFLWTWVFLYHGCSYLLLNRKILSGFFFF